VNGVGARRALGWWVVVVACSMGRCAAGELGELIAQAPVRSSQWVQLKRRMGRVSGGSWALLVGGWRATAHASEPANARPNVLT
jgi:hypothetical protein